MDWDGGGVTSEGKCMGCRLEQPAILIKSKPAIEYLKKIIITLLNNYLASNDQHIELHALPKEEMRKENDNENSEGKDHDESKEE